MPMRQGLQLSAIQRLALAPGLRQGMEMLRLPAPELAEMLMREAAENPFLIVTPRPALSSFDVALETVAGTLSVTESLVRQIGLMTLAPQVRALALRLVAELREDGYLDCPLAELAEEMAVPEAALEEALEAVQACDPPGIGARDLAECLALQLRDRGLDRALARRVVERIDLFSGPPTPALRDWLALPDDRIAQIASMLRNLMPHPVQAGAGPVVPLVPDLVLEGTAAGGFRVRRGRSGLPSVRLNAALLGRGAFGTEARVRAEAIVQAVRFRGATLLRIGTWIAQVQHRAFAEGPDHLVPVTRGAVAADLGLHLSTISRAVAGKALEVEGRLWPLSRFFSQGLPMAGSGPVSAFVVQRSIARMIAQEPAGEPLSDEQICQNLLAEGVDISRRTVAKYRGCLRIPASHERRRHRAPSSRRAAGLERGPA